MHLFKVRQRIIILAGNPYQKYSPLPASYLFVPVLWNLNFSAYIVLWRACNLTAFTKSHWSSGSTLCFPSWRTQIQSPGEHLCETASLLSASSHYIGDPDVIDHRGVVWRRLCPKLSLGRRVDNVIIPFDLTQLFCSGFTLAAGPPSGFTTDIVACCGGGSPVESLQSHCIHKVSLVQWFNLLLPVMRDPGSIPRGYLCETGILLSALSRYSI
jgi:hypothetical protein